MGIHFLGFGVHEHMNPIHRIARMYFAQLWQGYSLNTSNLLKYQEFRALGLNVPRTSLDLPEPDSDPLTVIRFKASQAGPKVIVDDTSLDVEGAKVGVNVRWLMDRLSEMLGRKAVVSVYLGVLEDDGLIYVYRGQVEGILVEASGPGFGFDPLFQPKGATKTLAQSKPDSVNARALAVKAFLRKKPFKRMPSLRDWDGPMQH